jgi:uncharacterized protein (DUF4415 family)
VKVKRVGLLAHAKRLRMKGELMKKMNFKVLTAAQKKELKLLSAMTDDNIDFGDTPEQHDWSEARRGLFYKPIKQQLTLQLDADLIDWFKKNGTGYQTRINTALRDYVKKQGRKSA